MAESNEQPPLCPCGFWGSAQTSGLCSICYKRRQQQSEEQDTATVFVPNSMSSAVTVTSCVTSATAATGQANLSDAKLSVLEPSINACINSTAASLTVTDMTSLEAAAVDSDSSAVAGCGSRDGSPARVAIQKNKKRCFSCKARLELAFVEIGRCKCGYTFCELHRLPEQHSCTYDHKESGRQEAREKMISPKKHVGTTLRRLDSDT